MRQLRLSTLAAVALIGALSAAPAAATPAKVLDGCVRTGNGVTLVSAPTSDGVTVRGALAGSGSTGVVLLHQSNGNLCQWWPYAMRLATLGYRALAIDLRGHGSTPAGPPDSNARHDLDAVAAVAELRRRGATRVFLVGASLGGTAALVAATQTAVDGVVSLSGPATYSPLDATAAVPRLRCPILFAAGADDGTFAADARDLHAAATVADKRLHLYPGGSHGVSLLPVGPEPHAGLLVQSFVAWHVRHVPLLPASGAGG